MKNLKVSIDNNSFEILQKIKLENNLNSYGSVIEKLLYEQESNNIPFDKFSITNRRYIGSKTKLLNFIEKEIKKEIGEFNSFLDIFSGTGVVANHFNKKDIQVITNDLLYSNYITNYAFLSDENFDYYKLNNIIDELNTLSGYDNYFSKNFGNKFFSMSVAQKIGAIREKIELLKPSLNFREEAILITSLIYAIDKIANTCGHYDAFRMNVEFIEHFKLKHLNIFHKNNRDNIVLNEDANKIFKKSILKDVDIIYADPPYNSRQYISAYHLIENLAKWQKPKVEGKASKMVNRKESNSEYCKKSAINSFEDLLNSVNCKYFILSYSDMGKKGNDRSNARMEDEDIIRVMKNRGKLIIKEMSHQPFSTGKSKILNHKERLFICKIR